MNEAHKRCGSDEWRAVIRESILPWALADVHLGGDVLEVGPGYGATTDVLAESIPKLTAVEIDPGLAAMLTERFEAREGVTVIEGDASGLEFPDARFTGAVSFTMLHHVPTNDLQDRVFHEVARVLQPGGVFVAGDSLARPELEAHHVGDTYNPVDPASLDSRLAAAGLVGVQVKTSEAGWTAVAYKPRR